MDGGLKGENRGIRILAHTVMIIFTVLSLAPFVILISSSISSTVSLNTYGYGFFPHEVSFDAYKYLFMSWKVIGKSYLISIAVTVIGTVLNLFITTMLAYALAWEKTPCRKLIKFLIVFSLLFNGGAVSSYIVWTQLFHIQNSFWAYILPNMLMNGFTVILFINYFRNVVPSSLMEAARIDGANMFTIFRKVYLPLSVPLLATMGISIVIGFWSDWNNGLYYIDNPDLYSVQMLLNQLSNNVGELANNPNSGLSGMDLPTEAMQMAIAVIGILPILITYPFFQKYFAGGIALGANKE